jgi:hypothetical protein
MYSQARPLTATTVSGWLSPGDLLKPSIAWINSGSARA